MTAFEKKLPVLGKEEFVRFASVTGDFNPVHYDLEFAKRLQLPNVISQGPLTFAAALDAIASEIGLDAVEAVSARTTAPVLPDTPLSMSVEEDGSFTVSGGETTYLTGQLKRK